VTVIQRFGSGLQLNVHAHALVLDGVFTEAADGTLRFYPAPPPSEPRSPARGRGRRPPRDRARLRRRPAGAAAPARLDQIPVAILEMDERAAAPALSGVVVEEVPPAFAAWAHPPTSPGAGASVVSRANRFPVPIEEKGLVGVRRYEWCHQGVVRGRLLV